MLCPKIRWFFPDRPIILHVHSMLHDAQFIPVVPHKAVAEVSE